MSARRPGWTDSPKRARRRRVPGDSRAQGPNSGPGVLGMRERRMEKALVVDEKPRWATALLRPGILAFGAPIEPSALHAHHTVQMLVARTPVTVMDAGRARHQGTQVIVPADTPYRNETATKAPTLYLDPETAAGAAAAADAHRGGWADDSNPLPPALADSPIAEQVAAIVQTLRSTPIAPTHRHAAVTEALHLLPSLVLDRTIRGAD